MQKRKINGKFISLVCLVLLIVISIIKIPNLVNNNKLKELGYSDEAIQAIYDKGLKKTIISNGYYSEFLESELMKDSFNEKYMQLYLNRNSLTDEDIYLYERLKERKGYDENELVQLFTALNYESLQPLVVFDKLENIEEYINDCQSHPTNSLSVFKLKGDYLNEYENIVEVSNPSDKDVFVSLKRSLGDYVPANLETVSRMNAISGITLETTCLEHFNELCTAVRSAGLKGIYAINGYVSYEQQSELFDKYGTESDAIQSGVIKPGHNEKQTGLVVTVVSSENENASLFSETEAYKWLRQHAHEYGFIFRYPSEKVTITGVSFSNNNVFRYVGVELATKIFDSGLTFDEYYMLYLD